MVVLTLRIFSPAPKRIVHQRVLPPLVGEFRNHKMIPFVLPLVLLIADDCTLVEYTSLILPVLIPALQVQDPIQVGSVPMFRFHITLRVFHLQGGHIEIGQSEMGNE